MKTLIAVLAVAAGLAGLTVSSTADAHGRRAFVSVGYGYPSWYYPYGYYGGGFYPRSYFGVGVYSRPRARRVRTAESAEAKNRALYVYPAGGQSEQVMADDRYECHTWSVSSTGFDPTLGAGSRDDADNYARAFTACMEGRNYVVR